MQNLSFGMYFLSFYGASVLHYKCSKIFNNGFTVIKNTFNNSTISTKLNPKYKNIKFALSITSGYQIVFNEKNKSVYKLLQKLHHEKLYSFSRLGLCFYGFRTSTLNNCEKILFNLKKHIKEYKKILVYALIGDLSKLKQKIQNKHKDFILCFSYKNKTNIVYYDE